MDFLRWCKIKWRAFIIILLSGFFGILFTWMGANQNILWLACIGGLLVTISIANIMMNLMFGIEY